MYHLEMPKDSALNKALVIFSGGLDSTVCLYLAKKDFLHVEALSFDYNQKHKIELSKAKRIAKKLEISQTIIKISSEIFLGSSLIDKGLKVPKKSLNKNKLAAPQPTAKFDLRIYNLLDFLKNNRAPKN